MRNILLSALLALAAAPLFAADTSGALGTWVSTQRSSAGLGMILTFLPDSKLESSIAALVETWYRIDGDKFMQPGATPEDKPTVARFHFEGDALVFNHDNDPPLRLTRVGTAEKGAPPIVGRWKVDEQKTIEYTSDGLIKIRYPITTNAGTWDSAAGSLLLPAGKGLFKVVNGLLILKMYGADEQSFIRTGATKEEIRHANVKYGDKPVDLDPPASH
jgi:hypothetical protein